MQTNSISLPDEPAIDSCLKHRTLFPSRLLSGTRPWLK